MRMNNWHVITGGPCCGKTTTVNILAARGYRTTIEGARHYLETQQASGRTIDEIRENQREFQLAVLRLQWEQESRLNSDELVFLDRALPDARAYYRFLDLPEDDLVTELIGRVSYRTVFVLDSLPPVHDYVRRENQAGQARLHDLIADVYSELGMPAIEAGLLLYAGVISRTLQFRPVLDLRTALGGLSITYALVLYPLLGWVTGHTYPGGPTFGAPCPVTMFTLGLLLWSTTPHYVLAVPIAWSIVGMTAVWNFGVLQDIALAPIAAIVIAVKVRKRWSSERSVASRYAYSPGAKQL